MTIEELAKLTPEEKRVKIAELCGWKPPFYEDERSGAFLGDGGTWGPELGDVPKRIVPDYLNDLNAMHKAEEILGAGDLGNRYQTHLQQICRCSFSDQWYIIPSE